MPDRERRHAWIFWLARLRASEEALGDVHEEFAAGGRSVFWLIRQVASTLATRTRHTTFEEGRSSMLSNLASDVRYTLRTFRRSPGFALAAIVPIALGIGINTSVFSILNNVAFRPLPTPGSSELIAIYQQFDDVQKRRVNGARMMFSMPEYQAYRADARTVSDIAAYTVPRTVTLAGAAPQEIDGILVTCNYFDVLRLPPSIGPGFTADNCEAADAQLPIVLAHSFWSATFSSDPGIIGRTLTLNDRAAVVVGVAPPGFEGTELSRAAFFMSTRFQQSSYGDAQLSWLAMLARRRTDAPLTQVRAELGVIAAHIDSQQPGRSTRLSVATATALSLPFSRRELLTRGGLVLGAFSLVLLIACANVANVLLARAAGRTREIAVRLSVGASRSRLVRQLLTESLVIALAGGTAGLLIGWWSFQILLVRMFSSMEPDISGARLAMPPDLTVLSYALGLVFITALVCGLVPALQASRPDVQDALKREAADTGGRRAGWLRGGLIAVQVAVCMVLLASAGLLLRALHRANTLDVGFDHQQVATVSYALRPPAYDDPKAAVFQRELMDRVGALPGVEAVAQAGKVPFTPGRMQTAMRLPDSDINHQIDFNHVSAEYFDILDIPLMSGRTFTADESAHGGAVIVSESTARKYWPGVNPVGRTMLLEMDRLVPFEVVGVARDALVTQSSDAMTSYVYLPPVPNAQRNLKLLVRSRTDPTALAPAIKTVASGLDAGLVVNVTPLDAGLAEWQSNSRMIAMLSVGLGGLALVLATLGVYGLVAYVVTRRRREVGIRLTLGATARDVQVLLVRQTLTPVAIGVAIGLGSAALASNALEGSLFGVNRLDPLSFAGAAVFLMVVAAAAALVPARAAVRTDPLTTLRSE